MNEFSLGTVNSTTPNPSLLRWSLSTQLAHTPLLNKEGLGVVMRKMRQ